MMDIYCRLFKIRIPLLVIKAVSYLVEWGYKVLHHYGMCQPQVLTPARIKYLTVHRTFSCNKAAEELGYKPIVTLMVRSFNSLGVVFMILFSVSATPFLLKCSCTFLICCLGWYEASSQIIYSVEKWYNLS